jgi:hypothetical protein
MGSRALPWDVGEAIKIDSNKIPDAPAADTNTSSGTIASAFSVSTGSKERVRFSDFGS